MNRHIIIGLFLCIIHLTLSAYSPASAKPAELESFHQDRCPAADHIDRINFNGRVLLVPENINQEQKFVEQIHSPNQDESLAAVMALAMAGNIEIFNALLSLNDLEKLRFYCSYYQNKKKVKCVDPVIEQAVIDHFKDPALLESLFYLFRKNLYQSTDLFEKILEMELDTGNTRKFGLTISALVANNIDGIEKQVLEHAIKNVALIDKKLWWFIMPVDKYYLDFFVQREYEPSLEFIQIVLNHNHYSTTPETYRVHLYNRQRALYYQLDKFSSITAGDIFITQLSKLINLPFDFFYNLELEAAGRYAISHAQTIDQRNQVANYLVNILKTNTRGNIPVKEKKPVSSKDDFNYKVYCRVIGLLAQTQTDHAASALVNELARLAGIRDDHHIKSKISQVLTGLSAFPESVSLDVPEFLNAVSALKEYNRSLTVVVILEKHPHPKGLEHLLSDLEYVVSKKSVPGFSYGMSNTKVFNWFINLLLSFDNPDYLYKTRQEIDRLFQEEKLDVKRYEAASIRLNALIGNESPLFTAMREQKAAEERERKKQLAAQQKADMWNGYEEQIAYHMSPEGIKKDIDAYALSGSRERIAISWLVMAGTRILPYVHEVLLDDASNRKLKFKLITLLGIIGDSRSIDPVIDVLQANPDMIHKNVFLSLSHMPITDESYLFVENQVRNGKTQKVQQAGLAYFAFQKEQRAAHWIAQFTTKGVDSNLQIAALFLAARLGKTDAQNQIASMLKAGLKQPEESVLLRALAELMPPEKFQNILKNSGIDPDTERFSNALSLARFRHASDQDKSELAEKLLKSEYLWDRREAVQYLIANNSFEILKKYILVDPRMEMPFMLEALYSHIGQLIILEASKMGYRIGDSDGSILFIK